MFHSVHAWSGNCYTHANIYPHRAQKTLHGDDDTLTAMQFNAHYPKPARYGTLLSLILDSNLERNSYSI